jgi:integrase
MSKRSKSNAKKSPSGGAITKSKPATLATLLGALERNEQLSPTRRRDLISAVNRVADLLGQEPAAIPLDMAAISAGLAGVNPVAAGMTAKRMANIRSDFRAAIKESGLIPVPLEKRPLSAAWTALFERNSGRRAHIGLSRLARYASGQGIEPQDVDDRTIDGFIAAVRAGSLHRKPNALYRQVTKIWNEIATVHVLGLKPVTVPSFREPPRRIAWDSLSASFRKDVDSYLGWCAVSDPFAPDARMRPLAPRTLRLVRDQIHAAVTALIEGGGNPKAIKALSDVVAPENFKKVLRRRLDGVGGEENVFNFNLGKALIRIALEWAKLDAQALAEVKRLFSKMPVPATGLTAKNKRFLRQFDDPQALHRLYTLPAKLWSEVKRDSHPNFRTLAKAQAALGIAILCYCPIRLQNLTALAFDTHIFLQGGDNAISTLELAADEVKNSIELSYDIPRTLVRMLIEYRERIAPKVIGHRPTRLFVNADGTPKSASTIAWSIAAYAKRRAGIELTPHQFRHLSAKVTLDAVPGGFELVRQFLGHKVEKTAARFYAGINSRRAARHHQRLIEEALAATIPPGKRRKRSS